MSVHPSLEVSGGALDSFLPAFTTLDRPYNAYPVICSNTHVETIFANKLRSTPYVSFRRECLRMQDNGVVSLDWVAGDDRCLSPKSPSLFLVVSTPLFRPNSISLEYLWDVDLVTNLEMM